MTHNGGYRCRLYTFCHNFRESFHLGGPGGKSVSFRVARSYVDIVGHGRAKISRFPVPPLFFQLPPLAVRPYVRPFFSGLLAIRFLFTFYTDRNKLDWRVYVALLKRWKKENLFTEDPSVYSDKNNR